MSGKKRPRKVSAEEKHLAESVFGASFNTTTATTTAPSCTEDSDNEDDIALSLTMDRTGSESISLRGKKGRISTAAWDDDDDETLEVDLRKTDRLRKLQKADFDGKLNLNDSKVSGTELSSLLKERFQTQTLEWALPRKSASDKAGLLQSTGTMIDKKGRRALGDLPPGRLDIQRMTDANAVEPSKNPITAIQFHSAGSVLLAAGADRFLRFFQIDGDRNEHLLAVRFNDLPISAASFIGSSGQVVLSGRKPFFYSYDAESGRITKVPGLMGKKLRSYEHMIVSPEGSRLAFLGEGGYVHVADGRTKAWQCDIKMNTAARAAVFSDENSLISSGLNADIYKWDLRKTGHCMARWKNADGTAVTSLSVGKTIANSYLAVGSESGVMTLYDGNIKAGLQAPSTLRTAMNLTTKVTSSHFHPSSQCVSYASSEQKDHLRVMHVTSGTIFSNWPTSDTPLHKVKSMAFSPGGGYFAVGNERGKVLLYRLSHFSQY